MPVEWQKTEQKNLAAQLGSIQNNYGLTSSINIFLLLSLDLTLEIPCV